jgi:uncharacterized protein YqgC (DUF456 family)
MTSTVRKVCGIGLIAIGLLGLLLPLLPGIPLILAGLIMLEINHPLVRACRDWLEARGIGKRKPPASE